MPESPPSFLRVHRGPDAAELEKSAQSSGQALAASDAAMLNQFWDEFATATGWRLAPRARRVGEEPLLMPAVDHQPMDLADSIEALVQSDEMEDSFIDSLTRVSAVGRSAATSLAASAINMVAELKQARQSTKRDQAELAARACVIASPEHQTTLAQRIETILSDAVAACDCTAAIVYTLDDDTSVLAARSVFGMSSRVLHQEPRSLKGCRGDLEAMVKGVVTMDDLAAGEIDTWNAPESAAAAICSVVCVGDVPIGTLWLLRNTTKSFGNGEAAAARMAARAIGVELSFAGEQSSIPGDAMFSRSESSEAEELAEEPVVDVATTEEATVDWIDQQLDELIHGNILGEIDAQGEGAADEQAVADESASDEINSQKISVKKTGTKEESLPGQVTDEDVAAETNRRAGVPPAHVPAPAVHTNQAETAIADVARWQIQTLPIGSAIADGWRVDGMIQSPRDFAIGWHLWDVLPDGSLALAMAESLDSKISGAMSATVARAAFASHASYRHTPAQMLARVGDTLWQTSFGEQLVSMLYIRVDPETGEGEVASAGQITAMIGSRYGYRPVVDGQSDPLCTHIDGHSSQDSFRMMPGETFLAYTSGLAIASNTHTQIGGALRSSMLNEEQNPLSAIRKSLCLDPVTREQGATTLMRS